MHFLSTMVTVLLVCLLATSVVAQDRLTIATIKPPRPTLPTATIINPTLPTIGPPDVCFPHVRLETASAAEAEEEEIAGQLDREEVTVEAIQRRFPFPTISPIPRCEDGPRRVIHTVKGEFHWPPIWKGSCNNLPGCQDPPCFPRRQVWRSVCVRVFKLVDGKWIRIGFRIRRFLDHQSCECKQCRHIQTQKECVNTYPCPNSENACSFCYWISNLFPGPIGKRQVAEAASDDLSLIPFPFGRCDCCTPKCCPAPQRFNYDRCRCECPNRIRCPPGLVFNEITCKCECPKGSKMNADGQCIGECDGIDLAWCSSVLCADNPHFKCKRVGYQCKCPSCDAASERAWCVRTKCLEQPQKLKCVFDSETYKCRCPTCMDQNGDRPWCLMTYCGPNNSLRCKWEAAWRKCFCPRH